MNKYYEFDENVCSACSKRIKPKKKSKIEGLEEIEKFEL